MPVILGGNTGIYLASLTPSVDPDAQAFITAAAITDPTQQAAINTLVVDLKGYGIWTKGKAFYPFVGSTASQQKFNLKDPRDLDDAFRLQFLGGWTHSSTGATPNGTNAYADTKLNARNILTSNNVSFGVYIPTTHKNVSGHGCWDLAVTQRCNLLQFSGYYSQISSSTTSAFFNSNQNGFIQGSRINATLNKLYRNGSVLATNTTNETTPYPLANFYFSYINNSGSFTDYGSNQLRFSYISDGLTDTEAANFYTAVQAFQTTLGRSIGTQTVSDADAQAFVTAANIQDQVEANAINNLVIGMKADGTWSKMKAVYPFVGGTNTSNSYNLKNTAQFQISWQGGVTSSANGVTFGANGYANTNFLDSNLTSENAAIGVYSRTITGANSYDFGLYNVGLGKGSWMAIYNGAGSFAGGFQQSGASGEFVYANNNGLGFYIVGKNGSTTIKGYKNATEVISIAKANATAVGQNLYLGTLNDNNLPAFGYSQRNWAFAFMSDGLSGTDATNLNTRVTTFQTALNRNI